MGGEVQAEQVGIVACGEGGSVQVRGRYHALDGMRGLAALLVARYHFLQLSGRTAGPGYLAVDFFFALSGFVIALAYAPRLARGMGFARFAGMRWVRLYPLYLLGALLGVLVYLPDLVAGGAPGGRTPLAALLGLAMLPAPPPGVLYPFDSPAWSLLFELAVNLLFAGLLWRLPSRWLAALAAVAAVALAIRLAWPPHLMNLGWGWSTVPGGVARILFAFPVGMLLARRLGSIPRRRSWAALVPVALLAAVLLAHTGTPLWSWWERVVVLLILPLTLALGIVLEVPRRLERACALLGDLSYPVYAIHYPLVRVALWAGGALTLPGWAAETGFLLLVCASGALAAAWFDAPMRAWLTRRLGLRSSAPEQAL